LLLAIPSKARERTRISSIDNASGAVFVPLDESLEELSLELSEVFELVSLDVSLLISPLLLFEVSDIVSIGDVSLEMSDISVTVQEETSNAKAMVSNLNVFIFIMCTFEQVYIINIKLTTQSI
jgi:hypothetical protein